MTDKEKKKLEEELKYLKLLIDFHNNARNVIWKDRGKELEDYLNSMLDHMNELRKKLEKFNKKDKS